MSTAEETKRQGRNRDDNIVHVSNNRSFTFYVFLAKKIFENHETVELHALGGATELAVKSCENLIRHGYATLESIKTDTIELDNQQKRAKLFITLTKSEDFDKKISAWEVEREAKYPSKTQKTEEETEK